MYLHRLNSMGRRNPAGIALMLALVAATVACLVTGMYALDEDVKKILRKATGITDEDARTSAARREISLFDAYVLAVMNTERLAIEGEGSIQAAEKKLQAIEGFFPYVSIRANLALPRPDTSYVNLARSAVSLYLRQPIVTGLREVAGIKSSIAYQKIRESGLRNNAWLMLGDIANAYYTVLLLEKDLKSKEQILALYGKTVGELKRRVSIGRSRQSEILRTNTQVYKLQADVKALQTNLGHARLMLSTMTGTSPDIMLADGPAPGEPAYSEADTENIVNDRLDVKAAREQLEYAKAGVLAAYGLHLPSIYLEGSVNIMRPPEALYETSEMKKYAQLLSGSPVNSLVNKYWNNGVPTKTREYYFSLGAEFPIFGGDITFAKVREANSIQRQADLVLSQTMRVARQDVIDALRTWESSKAELEAYRRALESSEENYRVVTGEYRLSQVTILDVLTALTTLETAKYDYERSLLQNKFNRIRAGIAANEFSGDGIRALK